MMLPADVSACIGNVCLVLCGHPGIKAGTKHFSMLPSLAKNPARFPFVEDLFPSLRSVSPAWPQSILFGQATLSYYAARDVVSRASVSP